jgi:hypothetical protein
MMPMESNKKIYAVHFPATADFKDLAGFAEVEATSRIEVNLFFNLI